MNVCVYIHTQYAHLLISMFSIGVLQRLVNQDRESRTKNVGSREVLTFLIGLVRMPDLLTKKHWKRIVV